MNKNSQVGIRMSRELKTWLQKQAKEDGRTMSYWIVRELEHIKKKSVKKGAGER